MNDIISLSICCDCLDVDANGEQNIRNTIGEINAKEATAWPLAGHYRFLCSNGIEPDSEGRIDSNLFRRQSERGEAHFNRDSESGFYIMHDGKGFSGHWVICRNIK